MMIAWLALGFVIGLQHALEADHVGAVGALVAGKSGIGRIASHGAIWGLGHTLTLALFGGAVFAFSLTVDESLAGALELLVGVMLLLLGGRLFRRLVRRRAHFHFRRCGDAAPHLHAHGHRGESSAHAQSARGHGHAANDWSRTFAVGIMHGLAGSAAIVALAASTSDAVVPGLLFILIFGAGSVAGMALLSTLIAVPLSVAAGSLAWMHRLFEAAAASFACGVGILLIQANGGLLSAMVFAG